MEPFKFKHFTLNQVDGVMKAGFDAILLGAWVDCAYAKSVLDIGTGSGLLSLILAQRSDAAQIIGIDIDLNATNLAQKNVSISKWSERVKVQHTSVQDFALGGHQTFDLIITNPPFFSGGTFTEPTSREVMRQTVKLSHGDLLRAVSTLLSKDGSLALVLPKIEGLRFVEMAKIYGLSPNRMVEVVGRQGKATNRVLLQLDKTSDSCQKSELIIRSAEGNYTEEYLYLVKDLYSRDLIEGQSVK